MPKNPDAPPGFPGYHHDADEPNTAFVRGPASGPFAIGDDLMPPRPSRPTEYRYGQPPRSMAPSPLYVGRRHDPGAEARLDRPTVTRRAEQQRLDDLVASVRSQILTPMRLERMARAVESGETAEVVAWADELARNVVQALGEDGL